MLSVFTVDHTSLVTGLSEILVAENTEDTVVFKYLLPKNYSGYCVCTSLVGLFTSGKTHFEVLQHTWLW